MCVEKNIFQLGKWDCKDTKTGRTQGQMSLYQRTTFNFKFIIFLIWLDVKLTVCLQIHTFYSNRTWENKYIYSHGHHFLFNPAKIDSASVLKTVPWKSTATCQQRADRSYGVDSTSLQLAASAGLQNHHYSLEQQWLLLLVFWSLRPVSLLLRTAEHHLLTLPCPEWE